jgi:hypothetical protein
MSYEPAMNFQFGQRGTDVEYQQQRTAKMQFSQHNCRSCCTVKTISCCWSHIAPGCMAPLAPLPVRSHLIVSICLKASCSLSMLCSCCCRCTLSASMLARAAASWSSTLAATCTQDGTAWHSTARHATAQKESALCCSTGTDRTWLQVLSSAVQAVSGLVVVNPEPHLLHASLLLLLPPQLSPSQSLPFAAQQAKAQGHITASLT